MFFMVSVRVAYNILALFSLQRFGLMPAPFPLLLFTSLLPLFISFTFPCLWPRAFTSPAFDLVPPPCLWYTLTLSLLSLVFAPSRCPVLLTYSLAGMLQVGWQVGRDRVPLFCLVTRDPPARPPLLAILLSPPPTMAQSRCPFH